MQIMLERNKTSDELAGKYVDLYEYADGQIEVRWERYLSLSRFKLLPSARPRNLTCTR